MLEGAQLYKKFQSNLAISSKEFDILLAHTLTPEQCGFGLREFKLDRTLHKIEAKQIS